MEQFSLVEKLIEPKTLKLLQVFFDNEDKDFYLIELSKRSGIPPASTFRIINKLCSLGIIELMMVNKFKFYKIKKDKETDFLKSLVKKDKKALDLFVERIREIEGVKQIVLHGKEAKDKADLLLIGDNIDASFVKSIAFEIKEKYSFTISWMMLSMEQYEQMLGMGSSMGLAAETKRSLFLRKTASSTQN
jgi:hypothetical protein